MNLCVCSMTRSVSLNGWIDFGLRGVVIQSINQEPSFSSAHMEPRYPQRRHSGLEQFTYTASYPKRYNNSILMYYVMPFFLGLMTLDQQHSKVTNSQ